MGRKITHDTEFTPQVTFKIVIDRFSVARLFGGHGCLPQEPPECA
jgi:hypothetical protein